MINNKLIHFKNKQDFNEELANGNILDTSIVFILDSKEIYTHGQYYGDLSECLTKYPQEFTKEEKDQMLENLGYYLIEWDFESETIVLSEEEYAKLNASTIPLLVFEGWIFYPITFIQGLSVLFRTENVGFSMMVTVDLTSPPKLRFSVSEIETPSKTSDLENDSNFVSSDGLKTINGESILGSGDIVISGGNEETTIADGVYAVDANGKLIDYNLADTSALGVALVAGEHSFMIAKSDATNDGSNYNLYYDYNKGDLSLTNYSTADGTNNNGYLGTELSDDFTTWTEGALSDFNGKANTQVIAASSSNAKDMCKVLETFNAGSDNEGHNDWYVPACGQLALMYLAKTDINAALAKIGGTALEAFYYWSSSEYDSNYAWRVNFNDGGVRYTTNGKGGNFPVRFVRDISVKPLKERVSDLETSKQDVISDLASIREGAALGATAILPLELASVAKSGSYNDLTNKPTIPSAVTESTVSGWGFTKNTGTVTGVKVNGSTKNPSSGIVDLGIVITAVDSSMSSTSTNPVQNKIIKSYIDSNCNIPTETTTASSKSLTANKYCRWTNTPTSITITLATPSNTSIVNNYMFEFTASSSGCTLSVPSTIKWLNGTAPSIEAGKTYQISIINNLATIAKFS